MSRALSAVALIAAHNEADVIEHVIRDLIANGLSVYFIDDGSTDNTPSLVEPFVGRGVIDIERIGTAPESDSRQFAWERLLRRKAQLATELDADWFLHHDADEFRESPWAGVPLAEAIRRVDALGYNAIDFVSLDFWPTHDGFQPGTDVRDAFPYYAGPTSYDRLQVRCWRKAPCVDLASGGHDVQFENRRVFPIRFVSRHYPIRGQAHGERKVFVERRPRFAPQERARNWHVQYDDLSPGVSFLRDPCELTRYDGDDVRATLMLRHRGVEALESSLEEARDETRSVREEGARHVGQIAALHGALDRMNHELAARHSECQQLQNALTADATELGHLRAQLEHVESQLERTEAQLERADAQIAAQAIELVGSRSALNDTRAKLDAVHRSWSWRFAAPARVALRWLRGY